jgi:P-type Ca2+ transporter type 2C
MTSLKNPSFEEIIHLAGDKGLQSAQVREFRERFGANVMAPPVREPLWKQYLRMYDNPIIKILIFAAVISAIVSFMQGNTYYDMIGIFIAIFLATGISFFNEYKSSKEFDILNAHRDDMGVKVIRDGHPCSVQSREIVAGDLIILEAGDAIPADGWVTDEDSLFIDESTFTGESEPVAKGLFEHLLKGTFVTSGKGIMISGAVGDRAQMGVIAGSLGIDHDTLTPLEQKLEKLAHMISKFGYIMGALVLVSMLYTGVIRGELTGLNLDSLNYVLYYLMVTVAIIVVAVPEGLPMSVALSLSLAMRKMTRANCLVRKLIACETIGSATTICTDKTGTLTKNQMEVVATPMGKPAYQGNIPKNPAEWITLNAAVNSTAYLEERKDRVIVIGNSTEGALLRWLRDNSFDYLQIRKETPVEKQLLFDSNRKRMSTEVIIGGKSYLLVKGAPEIISMICTGIQDLDGVEELTSRAMRTLAFSHKEITNGDYTESGLTWDGYIGIRDPLRENISESVATCQQAGIRVRMVTGDSPETARAIADEAGILNGGAVVTGKEFRTLSPENQVITARELDVMARAEPMDKLLLVTALQKNGDVVAVTGDGTNDAPALKNADVGLSMGLGGTEVAREASDIILLDDSFASITNAVWWGRSLYENIQRFVLFQITINICACILIFIAPILGYPEPFTILQILWINLIMDTLAALALCSEAPYTDLMKRQPVPRNTPIITPFMWFSIIGMGAFFIIFGLAQMETGFLGGTTPEEITTVFFATFVIAQIWNGINCRAMDGKMPPFFKGNPMFFVVMGLVLIAQILIVQYGGVFFDTVPLSAYEWVKIIVLSASVLVVGLLLRITFPRVSGPFTQIAWRLSGQGE